MRDPLFLRILGNNLVASITNFTVWFAVTFWVFLETRSVFATGTIAGIYLVLTAGFGFWFGSLVDHHPRKLVMLGSSAASFALYALAFVIHGLAPPGSFRDVSSGWLWALILAAMLGVIAGNIRSIALPALVTVLIPEDRRDRANGLVGMTTGIGFLTTSVISGFLVASGGMAAALAVALALTLAAFVHLTALRFGEDAARTTPGGGAQPKRVDIRGTIRAIAEVPGLFALIFFTTFNNFLGGIFMALLDAYGLSLVSVETWGLLLGVLSTAVILSGMVIAKAGLGKQPLRALLLVNLFAWAVACVFTLRASIWLLAVGIFIWMFFSPWAEAAEHTTLQKVVPRERQGRVFGFAQSVEQAASPVTAFLIGPLTEFVVIPFMTVGWGASAIGGWFGAGPDRGIALVFTVAGLVGVAATIVAFRSTSYRKLSAVYAQAPEEPATAPS